MISDSNYARWRSENDPNNVSQQQLRKGIIGGVDDINANHNNNDPIFLGSNDIIVVLLSKYNYLSSRLPNIRQRQCPSILSNSRMEPSTWTKIRLTIEPQLRRMSKMNSIYNANGLLMRLLFMFSIVFWLVLTTTIFPKGAIDDGLLLAIQVVCYVVGTPLIVFLVTRYARNSLETQTMHLNSIIQNELAPLLESEGYHVDVVVLPTYNVDWYYHKEQPIKAPEFQYVLACTLLRLRHVVEPEIYEPQISSNLKQTLKYDLAIEHGACG